MKLYKFLFPVAVIAVSTAGAGKSWANSDEEYCREFTQIIEVGGRKEEGYGTACQQPDGSWKIVKESGLEAEGEGDYYVDNKRVYVEPATTVIYERRPIFRPSFGVVYSYPPYRHYRHHRHWRGHGRGHHRWH